MQKRAANRCQAWISDECIAGSPIHRTLVDRCRLLSCRKSRFASLCADDDLSQILHLPGSYDAQGTIVLIQDINHAIDHRSQIATLLSQQDIEPPRLDGWGYNNAMH